MIRNFPPEYLVEITGVAVMAGVVTDGVTTVTSGSKVGETAKLAETFSLLSDATSPANKISRLYPEWI